MKEACPSLAPCPILSHICGEPSRRNLSLSIFHIHTLFLSLTHIHTHTHTHAHTHTDDGGGVQVRRHVAAGH